MAEFPSVLIDYFNREALAIDIDFSLPTNRVEGSLVQVVIEWCGNLGSVTYQTVCMYQDENLNP